MDNSFVVTIPPSIISTVSGIVFLNASYCASNSGTSVGNCGRYAPSAIAKYVVAFEEWVKKEDLGMVASHYDGFAKGVAGKLDSMLIPAFSMLIKQGTACAVEGDMKVATTYFAISHTVSTVAPPSMSKVSRISSALARIAASSVTGSAIAHIFSQSNCFV